MLFKRPVGFEGLPRDGFDVFSIEEREARRRAIIEQFHPGLEQLGRDLIQRLSGKTSKPLHAHLPRLDWPRGYQPFCTWLALSSLTHGYQAGPQLNVGVHADHVSVRLGWDAGSDQFGRLEFLALRGELGVVLVRLAEEADLRFRVYASARWPQGSRLVFESPSDLAGSFGEVERRGVWWELGRRYELPAAQDLVSQPAFGDEIGAILELLVPIYGRLAGDDGR